MIEFILHGYLRDFIALILGFIYSNVFKSLFSSLFIAYYYYYLLIRVFHISVFHWSFSDRKSPQVSRTLLSILAVLIYVVVCVVSTRSPVSKSSSLFNDPLITVAKAPITIGIVFTFMFHSFFYFLTKSWYLSFFSNSFSFILWSTETVKWTILQILVFFCC